uniref:Uncharacterized protein n=1 Tax=Globodera rostochiensis TaxID=31243 RepID=A0A914GQ47_GLORO
MEHSSIIVSLQLFLVLLVLHSSVKGSCCCCCDCCGCCCDCCCCCCGGSRNSNNAAATTAAAATGLAIGSALLASAGQAAIAPIDAAQETALGPELFPDGSTGRRNGQQLLVEIERGGTAGGVFFPGRRRRRRTRRFGKMDGINFDPMFPGAGGGQTQKSVFGNEPPGLGPGLLPDGSTGRKSQHDGHNNDFFDGMNFDGMHSPAAQRRQRQTHKLDKRHCGICPANECFCRQNCGEALKCPTKLKVIEIDSDSLQNYTVSRFLLGLIPKEVVQSKTKKSGRAFPEKVDAEHSSLSAEIDITSQQSSASSTSVSVEDNSSSPTDQKRFRPVSAVDDQQQQQKAEDLIARRLFLIPPVGSISGRMKREAAPLGTLPPPPLQFYKPTVPNPENADERLGVDDYD